MRSVTAGEDGGGGGAVQGPGAGAETGVKGVRSEENMMKKANKESCRGRSLCTVEEGRAC